jgi:outer membrane protein assembly factor BamB
VRALRHRPESRTSPSVRLWQAIAVCAAFVLGAGAWSAALAQSGDWPSFQGGPERTGTAPGAPSPPLAAAWTYPMKSPATSSPAVVGGAAIFETAGEVVAVDPSNGRRLWSIPRVPGPVAPVAVDPSTNGGILVYTEGGLSGIAGGTGDVAAVSLTDRSLLWAFTLPRVSRGGPTIAGGRVFVGTDGGIIYAIDGADGGQVWKAETDGLVVGPLAASGGMVFGVAENGHGAASTVYGWHADTGKEAWSFAQTRGVIGSSSPSATGGVVYVGMGDSTVRAFDASSGDVLWSRAVSTTFSPGSAPALAGGSVYALTAGGHLYDLRASDGTRVWDYLFDANSIRSSALVASDTVYAGLDDGTVVAVSISSGNLVWTAKPTPGLVGALVPAGDLILAAHAGRSGHLEALRHTEGPLTDIVSPSRLNLGIALLDFAIAAAVVGLLAAAFAALEARVRRRRGEEAL